MNNLRGYKKDRITPGYHRVSVPLRIADTYIKNNLKAEDPEAGHKYPYQLQKAMDRLNEDYAEAAIGGNMLDRKSEMTLGADDIRSLLWDVGGKLTGEELYFRNQDRLM